jgi:hypothetical protein
MKTVLLGILVLAGIQGAFAQGGQAKFIEVRGSVEIQDEGSTEWKAASPGDSIGKNTVVSTGFKSTAVISLGESRLSVRPLTRLTLEEIVKRDTTEEVDLYLRTGRVRAEVTPPSGLRIDFTVRSPTATASVRGTGFEFDTRRLYVDSGRVLLQGSNGQRVYVEAGQRSYIDESEQRLVRPFEAETALLKPAFSEMGNTGGDTRDYAPAITTMTDIHIGVDWR